ncbi:MAG TPA: condensation domain-containing protein, partial [Longimicrobiaceae bacterium]
RPHSVEVRGDVEGGALRLSWTYPAGAFAAEEVERVAAASLDALRGVIAHCRRAGAGGCTPSDFPLAGLTQRQLDAVVAETRVEDLYPLSPLQEGLLFHALYGGQAQEYQVQVARRLEGSLDPELLRRAWAEVVGRHAVLRTSFVWEGVPRPLQRVEAAVEVPWVVEDWRDRPREEQEAALERYLADDRARGFVLHRAPLLRGALFRVGDQVHWYVWNQHHLLLDGWSWARVENEVFALYAAWSTGRRVELGRVRPYRDYIGWLARQDPAAAERHWRGVLAGFAAPTPLPADRAAGPAGARYEKREVLLAPEATRRLEDAARRMQVTLNTVVQGAWAVLLSRYGGGGDVVFGATVSGRTEELDGVEEMVGLFINTLPVRVRVSGRARIGAWLAGLQREQAQAREHGHAPLTQVHGWSEVPRGTPLFESHFVFENYPVERGGSGGAGARLRVTGGRAVEWTNYPLSLMAGPGERLLLRLSYDESRFEARTVERMLGHLERVLGQMAAAPHGWLSELEVLGPAERGQVLEEWNPTDAGYPAGACIHHLFEAQCQATPHAAAVVSERGSLTYRELEERANRLAHHLLHLGAGPDARVALCLERGLEMTVALLGILKAGAAYVPLDPAYPAERLAFMLADSGARLLLTQGALADRLPAGTARVVRLDADASAIALHAPGRPRVSVWPDHLAYVIYTSGSTGRPKGVAMPHRPLVNLLAWQRRDWRAPAAAVTLQFAPLGFDVSFQEIFS